MMFIPERCFAGKILTRNYSHDAINQTVPQSQYNSTSASKQRYLSAWKEVWRGYPRITRGCQREAIVRDSCAYSQALTPELSYNFTEISFCKHCFLVGAAIPYQLSEGHWGVWGSWSWPALETSRASPSLSAGHLTPLHHTFSRARASVCQRSRHSRRMSHHCPQS